MDTDDSGKVTREEWMAAVSSRTKTDINIDKDQLMRKAAVVYTECDKNEDGLLNLKDASPQLTPTLTLTLPGFPKEFTTGYAKIEHFLSPSMEEHRNAEKGINSWYKLMPFMNDVKVVRHGVNQLTLGADHRIAAQEDDPMSEDEKVAVYGRWKSADPEMAGSGPTGSGSIAGMCFTVCFAVIGAAGVLVIGAPPVFAVIGAASGESCDQPLDHFCIAMVVIYSIQILDVILMLCWDVGPGTVTPLTVLGRCGFLGYWIAGIVFFDRAGGFESTIGDCSTVAPALFNAVWWYYLVYTAFACLCGGIVALGAIYKK